MSLKFYSAEERREYYRLRPGSLFRLRARSARGSAALRARNPNYYKTPQRLIAHLVHARIRKTGSKSKGSAVELLGTTVPDFVRYIEAQFRDGMTWHNRGSTWEFDHIKPLYLFDQRTLEGQKAAHHFLNWQPLLKSEHRAKTAQERRARANERAKIRAFDDLVGRMIKAAYKKPREKKPKTAEERRAERRTYYKQNKERILEYQRDRYWIEREKIRDYWRNISPEKRTERNARSRAWKRKKRAELRATKAARVPN